MSKTSEMKGLRPLEFILTAATFVVAMLLLQRPAQAPVERGEASGPALLASPAQRQEAFDRASEDWTRLVSTGMGPERLQADVFLRCVRITPREGGVFLLQGPRDAGDSSVIIAARADGDVRDYLEQWLAVHPDSEQGVIAARDKDGLRILAVTSALLWTNGP